MGPDPDLILAIGDLGLSWSYILRIVVWTQTETRKHKGTQLRGIRHSDTGEVKLNERLSK